MMHPQTTFQWELPVDLFDSGELLTVVAVLPGVAPKSLAIVVDGGALLVSGERSIQIPSHVKVRKREIPYGRMQCQVALPPGWYETCRCSYQGGCVYVELRKLSNDHD